VASGRMPAVCRFSWMMMPDAGAYCWSVPRVDPRDDAIERFIARHYRYDPERRERRHVVVAAFDNEPEFLACIERVRAEIERRREAGEPVDPGEHASGVVHEPGYLRRAANGHLAMRAVAHGAAGQWLEELELPSNVSVRR
jgi:hypothetical protein